MTTNPVLFDCNLTCHIVHLLSRLATEISRILSGYSRKKLAFLLACRIVKKYCFNVTTFRWEYSMVREARLLWDNPAFDRRDVDRLRGLSLETDPLADVPTRSQGRMSAQRCTAPKPTHDALPRRLRRKKPHP